MSVCAQIDANNYLVLNATPVDQCTGYVVMSASDWATTSFTNIPASGDLAAAWGAGFILPLVIYLIAHSVASVVNVFKT